ncbi:metallophosphoesterase [Amylibacter marinus]|uniref:Metallophosphoesterase n=1 Tax=Amylibacter marinus TaxID=1475483 RepID=A0ABQ5VSB6_9RHOB|nr:metallophosphoesterase [Amylibacter marinus]GLQ34039.1 metallophosphoesterase [Amylibacter marinus]
MSLRKTVSDPLFAGLRYCARRLGRMPAFRRWVRAHSQAQPVTHTAQTFSLENWPAEAPALRIALLSDFHFGAHSDDLTRFEKIVKITNAQEPDVILLLGDFLNTPHFGSDNIDAQTIAHILGPLAAPLGVWAVLGNHDWRHDGAGIWAALQDQNIQVLENEAATLEYAGHLVSLVGMGDFGTRPTDWNSALADVSPQAAMVVMAHDPASFASMPARDGIMFSGHTHGGQVRLPFFGALVNSSKSPLSWSYGHVELNKKQLFVTRGLGTSILPIRFNCPPEVCLITLDGKT